MTLCNASSIKFNAIIEPGFARGLEYYTGMIFEILVPEIDVSLGGGGRYDKLVELFGGQPTPAVGVAQGLDRITLAMDEQQATPKFDKQLVAVIPIEEETIAKAFDITAQLRKNGVATMMEVMGRKVARALQDANRREATYAIIIGPKELKEGKVVLRDMKHHQQSLIPIKDVATTLSNKSD
jgi:histidyl-tRNA synthetase